MAYFYLFGPIELLCSTIRIVYIVHIAENRAFIFLNDVKTKAVNQKTSKLANVCYSLHFSNKVTQARTNKQLLEMCVYGQAMKVA